MHHLFYGENMIGSLPSEDLWVLGLSIAVGAGAGLALGICAKYALTDRSDPKISDVAKKQLGESENTIRNFNGKWREYPLTHRNCFVVQDSKPSQEEEEHSLRSYNDLYFSDTDSSERET